MSKRSANKHKRNPKKRTKSPSSRSVAPNVPQSSPGILPPFINFKTTKEPAPVPNPVGPSPPLAPNAPSFHPRGDFEHNDIGFTTFVRQEDGQFVRANIDLKDHLRGPREDDTAPVMVVGVIGNTNGYPHKSIITNNVFRKAPFKNYPPKDPFNRTHADSKPRLNFIEISEDFDDGIVYIQQSNLNDVNVLSAVLKQFQDLPHYDFHSLVQSEESIYILSLLFIFEVCHYIIVLTERGTIGAEWLRVFRILQTCKKLLSPSLIHLQCELFKTDPDEIIRQNLPGQFVPTLAFYLPEPNFRKLFPKLNNASISGKVRAFKSNLEKQILRLLKRCHVLLTREDGIADANRVTIDGTHLDTLFSCVNQRSVVLLPQCAPSPHNVLFQHFEVEDQNLEKSLHRYERDMHGIRNCVERNIDFAVKHLTRHRKELKEKKLRKMPNRDRFFKVAELLHDAFFRPLSILEGKHEKTEKNFVRKVREKLKSLNNFLDSYGKFSLNSCREYFPDAMDVYSAGLMSRYTEKIHEEHLQRALRELDYEASGPYVKFFSQEIKKECDKIWKNGRRACDAISLTGKPCAHPYHGPDVKNGRAMIREHSSGYTSYSACSCGETRSHRQDPFDLKEANVTYFEKPCCRKLKTYRPTCLKLLDGSFEVLIIGKASKYKKNEGIKQAGFEHYKHRRGYDNRRGRSNRKQNTNSKLLVWDFYCGRKMLELYHAYQDKVNFELNQKRTTYAAKMRKGLQSTLVPPNDVGFWIRNARSILNKRKETRSSFRNSGKETVEILVGLEFECYKGHRFILDYQGIFKHSHVTHVSVHKGSRYRGADFPPCDVPLRLRCGCDAERGSFYENEGPKHEEVVHAQLQRIFVVTPSPPISVVLQPRIQCVRPEMCFETNYPLTLPANSLAVCRLPFVYPVEGRGVPPNHCRLLKGALKIAVRPSFSGKDEKS